MSDQQKLSERPWTVEHDGPSRPIIFTPDRRMLSVSEFQDGRWISGENEEDDCAKIVDALNKAKVIETQLAEAQAKLKVLGTITPCLNCDGSGKNTYGDCCRIPGHAETCDCTLCQWKNAYYKMGHAFAQAIRERDEARKAAKGVGHDWLELMEERDGYKAERDALAKALNRAYSYFKDIQALTKTSEDCPQWGRPDFILQMVSIRRCARKAELDSGEALATLERPAPTDGGKI